MIKTNSNGSEEWNVTFGGSSYDKGSSVQQTTDDGYIIAGCTHSYGAGEFDVWLIKTDSNGNEEWNATFGGNSDDWDYSVQQSNDDYIIAGYTDSYGAGGGSDVWLLKADADGDEEWIKTFGGDDADRGRSVQQTTDGGYIIAGWASSFGTGDSDVWLVKTDSGGMEEWNSTYGFEQDSLDWGYSVQQTRDGGYIIVGATMPDGWMHKGFKASTTEEATDVWLIKTKSSDNRPPDTPDVPQGPGTGVPGEIYDFMANTTDPDEDPIAYRFDWGDGTCSNWTEFVPSGTAVTVPHSWDDTGSYEVRVKAKDIHNAESPSWSPPHTIIIGEHSLQIKSIRGGIGITAVIKNDGEATIFHIDWRILVEGGVFGLIDVDANGTRTELNVAEEVPVRTGSLGLFHLGGITITVTVEADTVDTIIKEATGFVVGPFAVVRK